VQQNRQALDQNVRWGEDLPSYGDERKMISILNQKHATIGNYNGKACVVSMEPWEVRREILVPQFSNRQNFAARYSHFLLCQRYRSSA
jgi:hypothetical protein